jgi:hypothetical protein
MESQSKQGSIFGYLTDSQILQKPTGNQSLTPEQKVQKDSELKLLGKQIKRDCS